MKKLFLLSLVAMLLVVSACSTGQATKLYLGNVQAVDKSEGTLYVESNPTGAAISIYNEKSTGATPWEERGRTPLNMNLPPGTYVFRVELEERKVVEQKVTVLAGQISRIRIELPLLNVPPVILNFSVTPNGNTPERTSAIMAFASDEDNNLASMTLELSFNGEPWSAYATQPCSGATCQLIASHYRENPGSYRYRVTAVDSTGVTSTSQIIDALYELTCTDSDGGINYEVRGQVVGPIGPGEGSNGWDYCFTPNPDGSGTPGETGTRLLEWYCVGNGVNQDIVTCNCSGGACLPANNSWCNDTDGGLNYDVWGRCTDSLGNNYPDVCGGNGSVMESVCVGPPGNQSCGVQYWTCSYGCSEGACVSNQMGVFLHVNDETQVGNHTVRLINVTSSGDVVVSIDGYWVYVDGAADSNGVNVVILDTFYSNDVNERSATLQLFSIVPGNFMRVGYVDTVPPDYVDTVELINVASNSLTVVVNVSGVMQTVTNSETVNDVQINVLQTMYTDTIAYRAAVLQFGNTDCGSECNTTDGGDNIFVRGTDTYWDLGANGVCELRTWTDYCVDNDTLWEYNCRSAGIRECPNGCSDGACNQNNNSTPPTILNFSVVPSGVTSQPTSQVYVYATSHGANMNHIDVWVTKDGVNQEPMTVYCSGTSCTFNQVTTRNSSGYYLYSPIVYDAFGRVDSEPSIAVNYTQSGNVCTDSDGGLNYDVSGSVFLNGMNVCNDFCTSGTQVRECYCSSGNNATILHFCGAGQYCSNGACVLNHNPTISYFQVMPDGTTSQNWSNVTVVALDQDNNMHNITVAVRLNNTWQWYSTYCYGSPCVYSFIHYRTLQGMYNYTAFALDVAGGWSNQNSVLVNYTDSGSCSDSDGGLNYYTSGYVTGNLMNGTPYTQYDFCASGSLLAEQYCSGTIPASAVYTCPNGCNANRCMNQTNQPPNLTYVYVQYQYTNTTSSISNVTWSAFDINDNMAYVELKVYRNGVIQSTSTFPCTGTSCSGGTLTLRNQTGYYVYNATAVDAASARSTMLVRWLYYVP
ncbi:MAG: PEGA domain-containing protein [archaeon]